MIGTPQFILLKSWSKFTQNLQRGHKKGSHPHEVLLRNTHMCVFMWTTTHISRVGNLVTLWQESIWLMHDQMWKRGFRYPWIRWVTTNCRFRLSILWSEIRIKQILSLTITGHGIRSAHPALKALRAGSQKHFIRIPGHSVPKRNQPLAVTHLIHG